MNTKTAPEANTGRIVSKFWPSSLFIFVNSSWWFSASLVTSSCKRIWEVQTDLLLEQYMTHTWQQGNLSLTQSLSSVRESKMEDGVAETSTVHVCYCTFQCPPQCSKGFLVYGFGGNFSLGIQWVVPSGQDGPILPVWVSQCRIWLILPAQVAIIIIMNIIADCCYYLPWNLQLG